MTEVKQKVAQTTEKEANIMLPDNKTVMPDNIEVYILERDENRNPVRYREIEVPVFLAQEQLSLPPKERNKHWEDVCYKENADPRFF